MSGWLTRAAGALRGETVEQPDPFESVCECGVRHSGLRRRKPQRIICRSCGAALFILPRNAYPAPSLPAPRPRKRRRRRKSPAAVPPAAPPRFRQVATNVFRASEKVRQSAASAGQGFGNRIRQYAWAVVGFWTPLRLIILGILAVCGATVAYTLLSGRSEQAVMDLKLADDAARQALVENDIATAQEKFAAAVAALDTLGRHEDPLAREIRQLYRETSALRDLLPVPPLQIADEADTALEGGTIDTWLETFRAQYRDRWMIVQAKVQRKTSGLKMGHYEVDLPVRIGPQRRRVSLTFRLPELDRLVRTGKSRTVIFAAQLTGCELSDDGSTWELRVGPSTTFLWGTLNNYRLAGFTWDSAEEQEQAARVLAAQAVAIGLPAEAQPEPASPIAARGEPVPGGVRQRPRAADKQP